MIPFQNSAREKIIRALEEVENLTKKLLHNWATEGKPVEGAKALHNGRKHVESVLKAVKGIANEISEERAQWILGEFSGIESNYAYALHTIGDVDIENPYLLSILKKRWEAKNLFEAAINKH